MKRDKAAEDMFQLYANLLSVDARYAWNIIVHKTEANPYMDLQGLTRKGPGRMLRKSFEDCVMFHLLTVFPNNAAEQERYYITNVTQARQHSSVCATCGTAQFLHLATALLVLQPKREGPMNVPFAEADLLSQVL